jgi:hypothetical protein
MQIGGIKGQAVVVCTNRDQGLITPIYRTWPERFAWAYIREMEHFVQCIQTGTPPKVSGQDGRWAVAGVLAGTRSFLEERPVYLSELSLDGAKAENDPLEGILCQIILLALIFRSLAVSHLTMTITRSVPYPL